MVSVEQQWHNREIRRRLSPSQWAGSFGGPFVRWTMCTLQDADPDMSCSLNSVSDLEEPRHWEISEAPSLAASTALFDWLSAGGWPRPHLLPAAGRPMGQQLPLLASRVWWDRRTAAMQNNNINNIYVTRYLQAVCPLVAQHWTAQKGPHSSDRALSCSDWVAPL